MYDIPVFQKLELALTSVLRGWGRSMSGTQMVVVWPNSDGTITLSQRIGTGHVLPSVDSNPSSVATLQQSASNVRGPLFHGHN